MSIDAIHAAVTRLLVEAERLETSLSHHDWKWEQWKNAHEGQNVPEEFMDEEGELRPRFASALQALYLATVAHIDANQLPGYLDQFYETLGKRFDSKELAELSPSEDWPPYLHSPYLSKLRLFLGPLGINAGSDLYRQKAGIKCLESLLENTAHLLKLLKIKPKSETQVSRPVREVVKLMFEGSRNPPAGRFIKTFKYYKPDILVPDLSVAVEYKFIPSLNALNAALAGISDDAMGYTADPQYRLFYAVFYFARSLVSEKRFGAAWAEKRFPKEWVPIYVLAR
jgi:hypothetical protein